MESAVGVVHEQLPDARHQPGFAGFYLLADRGAGRLMTLSLWETRENLIAVGARAAELNRQTAQSGGIAVPNVTVYDVVVQA
jgi:heme-degrading monooxygenase HmoA